jgi:serpin B
LKELGARSPFDLHEANFSGMTTGGKNDLFISSVFHQTFLEINEEGCEAAAATSRMKTARKSTAARVEVIEFRCNRPFIFIIHLKSNKCILFMRKFLKP